jgi:hypothetical protein
MKAKLFKNNKGDYYLIDPTKGTDANDEGFLLGSSRETNFQKLSKQNCDEIFGAVDVEELAEEETKKYATLTPKSFKHGFMYGFNKAMELNKDKVFTLEEVMLAWDAGVMSRSILGMFSGDLYAKHLKEHRDSYRQSLQQPTEMNVEIVMDFIPAGNGVVRFITKFDSSGNLILKKI